SGEDRDAEAVEHSGHGFYVGIPPRTGLANTVYGPDGGNARYRMVLQRDLDASLNIVVLELVIGNIAFIKKDLRDFLFDIRCRNFNNPVVGLNSIPYSGQ